MKTGIKHRVWATCLAAGALLISACGRDPGFPEPDTDKQGFTVPTGITTEKNDRLLEELPFHDQQDFHDASRGLIFKEPGLRINDDTGNAVWNPPEYDFIKGTAPSSVNPSLWRQAMLNNSHGLFEVTGGIYQVRGYDLANMSIIRGKTGWIIVDPLTSCETAAAAMETVRKHLGDRPVTCIIYTHSHIDHFGGTEGIISQEEAGKGAVRIIAPRGFMEEATRENIIAGIAMGRRAVYQYGKNLERTPRGHVGSGLGKSPAYGTYSLAEPTELVDRTGQEKIIDGVRFVFQYTPDSEAPAEMTFYLPEAKAFCGAEIVSCNMHNLYTLRGAKIRDALKWSGYIQEAMDLFGDAEIYFGCHHWPKWGRQRIQQYLKIQRDTYKYIHDQTVRLFNKGYTPIEISEELKLPATLQTAFNNRGYYGTLKHNARAVYQYYMGWFDGNPANLDPLPPEEAGALYVEMMGGGSAVMDKAEKLFEKGNYRFVAQVLNHLVFAEPENEKAKDLLASTYDQLGYQAESGPWRDVYLTGAMELRHGAPEKGMDVSVMENIFRQTDVELFFDSMAVRLNGPEAEGKTMTLKIEFTDLDEIHELRLENSVLHHRKITDQAPADVTIRLTRDLFIRLLIGKAKSKDIIFSDDFEVEGSKMDLVGFLRLFEKPSARFNIVTP